MCRTILWCAQSIFYFYDRNLDFGLVVIYILISAFIWFIPFIVNRVSKEGGFNLGERLLLAFAVALLVLIESLHFSMYFFEDLLKFLTSINNRMSCIKLDCIIRTIHNININYLCLGFCAFAFFVFYFVFSSVPRNDAEEWLGTSNFIKFLYVLVCVLVTINALVLLVKLSPLEVKNQKSYEFISGEESGYRIIVEHYQDSVVLMQGSIDDGKLEIEKGDYRIEPLGKRQIEYKQFKDVDSK